MELHDCSEELRLHSSEKIEVKKAHEIKWMIHFKISYSSCALYISVKSMIKTSIAYFNFFFQILYVHTLFWTMGCLVDLGLVFIEIDLHAC